MDFDNVPEMNGMFGMPTAFGTGDLRAAAIMANGLDQLNHIARDEGVDAVITHLKTCDPLVKMAVLARFNEAWNEMVKAAETVRVYFHLFEDDQGEFMRNHIAQLKVVYERIKTALQPEIDARIEAGFDTPWDPGKAPEAKAPILSDEENQRASFILSQLFQMDDAHLKPLDD